LIGPKLAKYYGKRLDVMRIIESGRECANKEDHWLGFCDKCDSCECFDCRLEGCKWDWYRACGSCMRKIFPKLAKCYDNMQEVERILEDP